MLVLVAHAAILANLQKVLHRHHGVFSRVLDFDAGDLGVSVFFVISGFLITTLLLKQSDSADKIQLKHFYLRRFFRIFPPYYFYLLIIGLLWSVHIVVMLKGAFLSAITYTSNYYPYTRSHPDTTGWLVGHTWSLSLEEQFYCFWPACLHFLGKKKSLIVGLVLLALAPISRVLTLHLFPSLIVDGQIYRMFHTRIDTIMAGCILALLANSPRGRRLLVQSATRWWSGVLAAVLLYLVLRGCIESRLFHLTVGLTLEAVLLAVLLFYCVENPTNLPGRILNHAALRHIGVISYSLYLWQQLFVGPLLLFHHHRILIPIFILLSAEFSYWVVERWSYVIRDRMLTNEKRG